MIHYRPLVEAATGDGAGVTEPMLADRMEPPRWGFIMITSELRYATIEHHCAQMEPRRWDLLCSTATLTMHYVEGIFSLMIISVGGEMSYISWNIGSRADSVQTGNCPGTGKSIPTLPSPGPRWNFTVDFLLLYRKIKHLILIHNIYILSANHTIRKWSRRSPIPYLLLLTIFIKHCDWLR